jgi:hypothetical protein
MRSRELPGSSRSRTVRPSGGCLSGLIAGSDLLIAGSDLASAMSIAMDGKISSVPSGWISQICNIGHAASPAAWLCRVRPLEAGPDFHMTSRLNLDVFT